MTSRNSRPLTATQGADRIAAELAYIERRVADKRAAAEANERTQGRARIKAIMARVSEHERDKVAKVLLALGCDLSGFELQAGNDVESERTEMPPELEHPANRLAREAIEREVPQALRAPVPPLRPGERQTVERK